MPSRVPRNGVSRQTTFQNRRKTGVYGRALASAAMEFMEEHQVTVLFLVDEAGAPVGILHIHDLLRAGVA
ncbi:hypothetical protein CDO23_26800 (plasmid) [Sinorhizobium meliloti]|nr:hypothetical protein CDO23_26800 [Sinorhizobium meliloti]